jgi:alcohol dehydrogenase (cytochrome c)
MLLFALPCQAPAGSQALAKASAAQGQLDLGRAASADKHASEGVYTSAQATRGRALFGDNCAICHGGDLQGMGNNPPLAGPSFLEKWGGLPLGALHGVIDKSMPPGNGGLLGAVSEADVVAYILSQNGFPAGANSLPVDASGLSVITIDKPGSTVATLAAAAAAFAQTGAPAPSGAPAQNGAPPRRTPQPYVPPASFSPPASGPVAGAEPGGNTNTLHPIDNFVPVTDDALRSPDPSDWLLFRGNYQGWGFSKLNQINKTNVKGLQLVWSRLMDPGVNEGTPLVYKGVMYLANPNDVIQAIDAATGELLWQYRRRLPTLKQMNNDVYALRKRDIFLWHDKIYTTTGDSYLVALDARTGKEIWQVSRGGDLYATSSTGPIVVNGIVLAGSTCQFAPFPCFVDAHDAETGKLLWRNEVVPKRGEPGDETWAKKPYAERWGTGVWGPMVYDPDLNMLFYGSSGVTPASEAQRNMVGATMAGTNTRWAVDPRTGKVIWRHQVLPEDNWDQECTFEMMPIITPVHPDAKAEGMMAVGAKAASNSRKTLTGVPCKTSIMWSFDAANGDFLWAKSTALQNVVDHIDHNGRVFLNESKLMRDINANYHVCPSTNGGRDWPFSAYSPETNVMYVQLQNLCMDTRVRADNIPSGPSSMYNTRGSQMLADGKTNIGRIDAISVETGKTLWTWETRASNYSPILATSGGLLFNGGLDRWFRGLDQSDGKVLWQARLGSQIHGAPVSFSVNGRQYIAVAAGGGWDGQAATLEPDIDQPAGGNMIYVFALPE